MRTTHSCMYLLGQHLRKLCLNVQNVQKLYETQCKQYICYQLIVTVFRAQLAKFNLPSVTVAGVDIPVQANHARNLGLCHDKWSHV